jgi:hypothetical protein
VDTITVSVGGGEGVPFTGTPISVAAGSLVIVVAELSGPLAEPISSSSPAGAFYNPGPPPTIVWSYNQPPNPVNVSAQTASCEYDLGVVTDGTP